MAEITDQTASVRVRLMPKLQDRLNAEVDRIAEAGGVTRDDVLRFARELLAKTGDAALAAHPTGPGEAEPVAWKLVPAHPLPEMLAAWWRTKNTGTTEVGGEPKDDSDVAAYRAMLEAAPTPPAGDAGAEPAGREFMVRHPLTGRDAPAWIVLSDMAAQENCDGEPYDTMQAVADVLLAARSRRPTPAEPPVSPAGGEDLEGLSAKATPGFIAAAGYGTDIRASDGVIAMTSPTRNNGKDDRAFIVALWNAYRSGALLPAAARPAADKGFAIGQRVRKVSGSSWQGTVVGFYSTDLTPDGICVESERERGSVQIYPAKALAILETEAPDA